jgi:hypothetical protein
VWFDGTNPYATDFVLGARLAPSVAICSNSGGACPDVGNTIPGELTQFVDVSINSKSDCVNDVVVVNGRRSGNYLIVEYTRPLAANDNCDMEITLGVSFILFHRILYSTERTDCHPLLQKEMNAIYAVGPNNTAQFPYNIRKHTLKARGASNPYKITFNIPITTRSIETTGTTGATPKTTGTTGDTPRTTGTTEAAPTSSTTSSTQLTSTTTSSTSGTTSSTSTTTSFTQPTTTTTSTPSTATSVTQSTSSTSSSTQSANPGPSSTTDDSNCATAEGCRAICGNFPIVECSCLNGSPIIKCFPMVEISSATSLRPFNFLHFW